MKIPAIILLIFVLDVLLTYVIGTWIRMGMGGDRETSNQGESP